LSAPLSATRLCRGCSGPKPPGRGRAYCDPCRPVLPSPVRDCLDCGTALTPRTSRWPKRCEECARTRTRSLQDAWMSRQPATYTRGVMYRHRYKKSLEDIQQMLLAQGNRCKYCLTADPGQRGWHVDHDHSCCAGERSCGDCVRWLLCNPCNQGLGHFHDDIERMERAISNMREWRAQV
jgi:hypothetical protein